MLDLRRRQFITLLGGAAAAWPFAGRAQQPGSPVIGFLSGTNPSSYVQLSVVPFHAGLRETGYVEGQNIVVEYRWAHDQYDRLPGLAAELVRHKVALIATAGGVHVARAAKATTTTIPIVFVIGSDPIDSGLVESLGRPGGNATGFSLFSTELGTKRLELMRDVLGSVPLIAVLVNPTNPRLDIDVADIQKAAGAVGQKILVFRASSESELDAAFSTLIEQGASALLIESDPFFTGRVTRLAALAARHRVPASYSFREFAAAGGLISYGTNIRDVYRQAGVYAGRILKGANPSDLPVLQPSTFELVINLKTARTLGINVPLPLLARADEVIE
jgi:putative tryptophan/tyrosine transport system substrate-binding protein